MGKLKIHNITLLSVILILTGCEKQANWDIKPSARFLVADCIITNEYKNQEVKLYYSSSGLNETPEYVSGAEISISDGQNHTSFAEDSFSKGTYFSVIPFQASSGKTYTLAISYDSISDTARAEMVGITSLETMGIVQSDSLFKFVYHESSSPSMLEVSYDWSQIPDYCNKYGACEAAETFYTLDNIDVSKIFAPDKETIIFPRGTRIIRRKYSLSPAHQEFVRSMLLETEWRGGIFDTEQGNVPTNFSGKIRGWFAACMVLSDTTNFK